MQVVALVSGGKDSCYAMMQAKEYGHEVVALANLLPNDPEVQELDSYMYQTVGHEVVEAYAQCMGVPLFRRTIQGKSKLQDLVYDTTQGDEVEDLLPLLSTVHQHFPHLKALCCGAIASDYQRTRVENVCARLGLVCLSYLWHQPQGTLLSAMVAGGIDAILVKVAAIGLSEKHVGKSLAQMQPLLRRLSREYGSNICGEGGEYESLTLDCPLFTRGRIVCDDVSVLHHSPDSIAPVALLRVNKFHVVSKLGSGDEVPDVPVLEVPPDTIGTTPRPPPSVSPPSTTGGSTSLACHVAHQRGSSMSSISCMLRMDGTAHDASTSQQAQREALEAIQAEMLGAGLTWSEALFVNLYIPCMAHFAAVNSVYSQFLPAVNPPARACVQLPGRCRDYFVVDVLYRTPRVECAGCLSDGSCALASKRVLHVQSISAWAPSCIGPYSQSNSWGGVMHMAGQIALDPPTMEVVKGGSCKEAARCLQSCQAVCVAQKVDLASAMLWVTVFAARQSSDADTRVATGHAQQQLNTFLEGEGCGLVGDGPQQSTDGDDSDDAGDDSSDDVPVDSFLLCHQYPRHWQPLSSYVVMEQLPRRAAVEYQTVSAHIDQTVEPSTSGESSDDDDVTAGSGHVSLTWVQRLRNHTATQAVVSADSTAEIHVECLYSPARLLRCHVHTAQKPLDEGTASAIASALWSSLQMAGLSRHDVCSIKAWVVGEGSSTEAVAKLLEQVLSDGDCEANSGLCVVPAVAIGCDCSVSSSLLVELTAMHVG